MKKSVFSFLTSILEFNMQDSPYFDQKIELVVLRGMSNLINTFQMEYGQKIFNDGYQWIIDRF